MKRYFFVLILFFASCGLMAGWKGSGGTGIGSGGWQDDGTDVRLVDPTDEIVIGSTTPLSGSKFTINGDADQIQAFIQGHSTQTTSLFRIESSTGLTRFEISGTGRVGILTPAATKHMALAGLSEGNEGISINVSNGATTLLHSSGSQITGNASFPRNFTIGSIPAGSNHPNLIWDYDNNGEDVRFDDNVMYIGQGLETTVDGGGIAVIRASRGASGINNLDGWNLYLDAGQPTGAATPGVINLRTSRSGTSGSVVQNYAASSMQINAVGPVGVTIADSTVGIAGGLHTFGGAKFDGFILGGYAFTQAYIGGLNNANTTEVIISSDTTWTKVTGWTNSSTSSASFASSNGDSITLAGSFSVEVLFDLSFKSIDVVTPINLEFNIFLNGAPTNATISRSTLALSTDVQNVTLRLLQENRVNGDDYSLGIRNLSGAEDLTIVYGHFIVRKL